MRRGNSSLVHCKVYAHVPWLTSTELPLVVAELPHRRQQLLLDLRLLHLVLYIQTTHNRLCVELAFLQLQFPGVRGLWIVDRHGGISDGVCFYSEDV